MKSPTIGNAWPALLLFVAALCAAGAALADQKGSGAAASPTPDQPQAESSPDAKIPDVPSLEPEAEHPKSAKAPSKRDPAAAAIASAFALPRGTVLSTKQNDAMKKLKTKMEPVLRADLEKLEKLPEGSDKTAAALKIRETKKDIKAEVDKILDMPDNTNQQPNAANRQMPRRWPSYPNRYF